LLLLLELALLLLLLLGTNLWLKLQRLLRMLRLSLTCLYCCWLHNSL
jgi:hypothetical protein